MPLALVVLGNLFVTTEIDYSEHPQIEKEKDGDEVDEEMGMGKGEEEDQGRVTKSRELRKRIVRLSLTQSEVTTTKFPRGYRSLLRCREPPWYSSLGRCN
jgi:hypothetical protein